MQRQREIELRRALREIRTAIDRYKDAVDLGTITVEDRDPDEGGYPPDLEALVDGAPLAAGGDGEAEGGGRMRFLRRVPRDPLTRDSDWGLRSYQDPPDARRWGGGSVYDVYSLFGRCRARRFEVPRLVAALRRRGNGWTLVELTHRHLAHRHPVGNSRRGLPQCTHARA